MSHERDHDQRDCSHRDRSCRNAAAFFPLTVRQRHEQGQQSDRVEDEEECYESGCCKFVQSVGQEHQNGISLSSTKLTIRPRGLRQSSDFMKVSCPRSHKPPRPWVIVSMRSTKSS
jgi:hypothetical protein